MNSFHRYFRQAKSASAGWNLWKTFLQSIVFWSVFLWWLPLGVRTVERAIGIPAFQFENQFLLGLVLFSVASPLNIWSGVAMATRGKGTPLPTDCPRQLVVAGPYRWIRNPMAVTGLTQGLAIAIATGSWLTAAGVLIVGIAWNVWVRPVEERHLVELFGDEYRRYQANVRCWIPRFRPYCPGK